MVSWSPPVESLYKLNCDGSVLGNPELANIGGVIRNSASDILLSFLGLIGRRSVDEAELFALRSFS